MISTPSNVAVVLNFDLDGIDRWTNDVLVAATDRAPGHLKVIRDAARQIRLFSASLAKSHAQAVCLIPDAPSLADSNSWG